jgi:hypothetical protein
MAAATSGHAAMRGLTGDLVHWNGCAAACHAAMRALVGQAAAGIRWAVLVDEVRLAALNQGRLLLGVTDMSAVCCSGWQQQY